MAGDWIKMRHDLRDDPAVIQMASALHLPENYVVGLLHRFWSWADKHTRNGDARSVTIKWLDEYIGVPGFAEAMQKVSWLCKKNGGFRIPKFNAHNSKSAKKRALTARRMRKLRDAPSVTKASTEKRREEKSSSLDRSIDRFDRIDESTWKKAQAACRTVLDYILGERPSTELLKPFVHKIAKACVCVEVGVLPPEWLTGAIDKFLQPPTKKRPAAWLGKVLAADAAELGKDFDAYQRAITLPKSKGPTAGPEEKP